MTQNQLMVRNYNPEETVRQIDRSLECYRRGIEKPQIPTEKYKGATRPLKIEETENGLEVIANETISPRNLFGLRRERVGYVIDASTALDHNGAPVSADFLLEKLGDGSKVHVEGFRDPRFGPLIKRRGEKGKIRIYL